MEINWNEVDKLLLSECDSLTCDINEECANEIENFVKTHNFSEFSDESLELLAGIWDLALGATYEKRTGQKIPNIFRVIE